MSGIRVWLSWLFYRVGDLVDRAPGHSYQLYDRLMWVSYSLQGDGPRGPWSPISDGRSRRDDA